MSTTTRATLEELLEFANKVRTAGGGNPLDALLPAVPEDPKQCLIAKNLNFNCEVFCPEEGWVMRVDNQELASKISEAIGCEVFESSETIFDAKESDWVITPKWDIQLPERIGQVAADFDSAASIVGDALGGERLRLEEVWLKDSGKTWDTVNYDSDHVKMNAWVDAELKKTKEFKVALQKEDVELYRMVEASTEEAMANATLVTEDGNIVI